MLIPLFVWWDCTVAEANCPFVILMIIKAHKNEIWSYGQEQAIKIYKKYIYLFSRVKDTIWLPLWHVISNRLMWYTTSLSNIRHKVNSSFKWKRVYFLVAMSVNYFSLCMELNYNSKYNKITTSIPKKYVRNLHSVSQVL